MNSSIRDLLYRSLDDALTAEEQQQLDTALASSPELREEYDQLVKMRHMVSENAATSFEPWFAQRVMRQIESGGSESELFFETLFTMFRRVAVAAAVAVAITISYNVLQSDTVSLSSTLGLEEEPTWEEMLDVSVALESEGAL